MSIMYERISAICEQKNIRPGRICTDTGLSRGMMTDLKMGRTKTLSAKSTKIIADYLGVSVGYLLGEDEQINEQPTVQYDGLSEDKRKLIMKLDDLSEDKIRLLLQVAESFD